ncbi:hypothetical protein HII36_02105 [Nonomuraea sp. NN258]|uniref:hypothetical protein n=1 Tax=Nonomuraea antri TaxID=2730852 RepID=UPI00156A3DD9|nr:hypothetical protein [Nonomuraea antri]NRQ30636.1 hypothetical protein [Nonomuraea antri]
MNALIQEVAQRFPLIARPRPACLPLQARVDELRDLAAAASQGTEASHLALAAEAMNKAALIASDCGVTALARSLCWRHFSAYLRAWPLNAPCARRALEPLVNLARLAIREHDGSRGYLLLNDLFHAVSTGGTADIDGHHIPFAGFTRSEEDLRVARKWLWGVFVAEGIRALISAGQWDQAVAHAEQHRGVGQRLLDGRQAAILARCLDGQTDIALKLVADSKPLQAWEHSVGSCLELLCNRAAARADSDMAVEVQRQFLELDATPELLVFRTRLGLAIVDLTVDTTWFSAKRVFVSLISDVLASANGYVAQDVLAHHRSRHLLSLAEQHELISVVQQAGLGLSAIPASVMSDIFSAVKVSETAIEARLNVPTKIVNRPVPT